MALINKDDVQAWFTDDRLSLEITDDLPEEGNVSPQVLGAVSSRYDVSTWIDRASTPELIRSIISAQVAAIRYSKHYADQLEELAFADWLNMWAKETLEGVINGSISLLDVSDNELAAAQDAASMTGLPNDQSEAAKFTMDMSF